MRVLELFSGTQSVGKVGRALGYEVISLDLTDATICCDIMEWDYKTFSVGYFDIIYLGESIARCEISRSPSSRAPKRCITPVKRG